MHISTATSKAEMAPPASPPASASARSQRRHQSPTAALAEPIPVSAHLKAPGKPKPQQLLRALEQWKSLCHSPAVLCLLPLALTHPAQGSQPCPSINRAPGWYRRGRAALGGGAE